MDGTAGTESAEVKKDDSLIALGILIAAAVVVITMAVRYFTNRSGGGSNSWKKSGFSPPQERQAYLDYKPTCDRSNPEHRDNLRKLLMKRAIHTIPLIMLLQNEGQSIDRLYKKGMLTDDMHYKAKELKAFVDQEVGEVQAEADDLSEGWGQIVWQQAMQIYKTIQKQAEGKAEAAASEQAGSGGDAAAAKQPEAAVDEEAKKKQAAAQKKREKDAERAKKVAAMRDIGAGSAPTEDPEKVAQRLIEEEEREKAKKKKGKK